MNWGTLSPRLAKVGTGGSNRSSTYYTHVKFNTDFILKSGCNFSQASFVFLSTPFPVQFIKRCSTVSISPQ